MAKKEVPEILYRITDMIKDAGHWEGTATELLSTMGETEMKPNTLSARISTFYYDVLYPAGVRMRIKRTAMERLMIFTMMEDEDPNEISFSEMADDSAAECIKEIDSVSVPDTPNDLTPEESHMMAWEAMRKLGRVVS